MSVLNTLINCPQLQTELNTIVENDPTKVREQTVLHDFLYSDVNRAGSRQAKLQSDLSPGDGKSRVVQLVYSPRLSEGDVKVNEGRDTCTTTRKVGETSTTVDVGDNYIQDEILIEPRELRYTCKGNTQFVAEKILQKVDVLVRKKETMLFQKLNLRYGNFATDEPDILGGKVKSVSTKDSSGKYSTDAFEAIGQATSYAGYSHRPVVIGGREMGRYMRATNAGCCAIDGIDVGRLAMQYPMGFAESYRADSIFGTSDFMTLDPGAAQIIEWLEYEGPNGINYFDLDTYKQLVIADPRSGAKFDMQLSVDCGKINVFIRTYFDLFTLPVDMFYSDDRLAGVNMVNRFKIVNP